MEKIILSLLLSVIFTSGFTQTGKITVAEALKISKYNFDDFDTYVIKKGFEFNKTNTHRDVEENEPREDRNYKYYSKDKLEYLETSLTLFDNTNRYFFTYTTTLRSEYLKMKDDLKLFRFKYVNTNSVSNKNSFVYQRDDIFIQLDVYLRENLPNQYVLRVYN